ncbi:chaperonin 10-like protein [Pseudomassariella vexata]|uniref:L-arabinitol 4-dehydrogenase n=1 Tax=Pseudomassariella vexata TaxID=1141098 RepID=A0A1Y2DJ78_9PEZI|nr:chaperonin 10-like protein [Pseudomassariella vexata]ORY59262.1 chaperonin 10-like protein [Pseudomassariella vexata]
MTSTNINPAFVLQSIKNVSFENRPIPQLRDEHDVRVHIKQTGICGSDVHYWQRGRIGDFILDSPIVLGHESAGTVVEVGSKVKNVKVGTRVAIEPGVPCRHCDYCRSGAYNLCADSIFAATPPWDGTLQKYYIVAGDYCYPIPDHMSAEDGALVEPVAVAVQICKVADLRAGQTVLVFGCGPIGALCQAVAKGYGATKVIGVDISKPRAEFARGFGADDVYVPEKTAESAADPIEASRAMGEKIVQQFGLGEGADVVLECTGAEPCIQAGVFATKKGGTYVQAGMGKENVVFPITTACIRALNIKGSIRYTAGCYPAAVDLVASGKVKPRSLITHRFKFEESLEAFELVRKGQEDTLKVIIHESSNILLTSHSSDFFIQITENGK